MTCAHPVVLLGVNSNTCARCLAVFPVPRTTSDRRPCGCHSDPAVFGHAHAT